VKNVYSEEGAEVASIRPESERAKMVEGLDRRAPICSDDLRVGDVIARRYHIESALGDGGIGRLYRARSSSGGELALRLTIARGENAAQNLAEVVALHKRIGHPRLCALRDCGEHGGRVWYAMDYLQGTSLEQLVAKSGPFVANEAARIITDAADAVAAAHRAGFAYQDMKQATIFLVGNRDVKLLDFGVNAALAKAAGVPATKLSTPSALASGHADADPRQDLYALGAVLYYALTGRRAFPTGRQVVQLASSMELPTPSLKDVPKPFHRFLKQALAMRVSDRFQTLDEFMSALVKARA
jgi:serine/threonine protein kinase